MATKDVGSVEALSRYEDRRAVPEPWGRDELTKFLSLTEEQMFASAATYPDWMNVIVRLDQVLVTRASDLFHEVDESRQVSAQLFMRAFGTYRAACRLALSGQLFETFVLLRSIIESSVYAWKCAQSPDHRQAWLARADDDEGRKASKKLFQWTAIITEINDKYPRFGPAMQEAYEKSIDLGAHPNVEGIQLSSDVKQTGEDRFELSAIYMHGKEAVLLAILELTKVMSYVYNLMTQVVGERMRILSLDEKMEREMHAILGLIQNFELEGGGQS